MARCGCAGSVCSCNVEVVGNGSVEGTGSEGNPFVITIDPPSLDFEDTASVTWDITGTGTDADPLTVQATATGADPGGTPAAAPLGSVLAYAGHVADIPTGWLLCDGSSKSTTTYADLFGLIAYTYGGAGASFNLPDCRNRFIAGVSAASDTFAQFLSDTEGQDDPDLRNVRHTHPAGDLETNTDGSSHTHDLDIQDPNMNTSDTTQTGGSAHRLSGGEHHVHTGSTALTTGGVGHTHGVTGDTGENAGAESSMPFIALNFIIKYLP